MTLPQIKSKTGRNAAVDRTRMLCDEVCNLGRIDAPMTVATLMRSWGLTLGAFFKMWRSCKSMERRRIPLSTTRV